jgi:hypothetical protein
MAIIRKGTLTVTSGGTAQNLILGFVPSHFRMVNKTKMVANTNGVQIVEWFDDMANASAYLWTTTTGAPVISYTSTNGVTPYTTTDGSLYPSTNLTITGISKAANASITATHAFTSADVGVTTVSFHNILGMTQMNTLTGVIQSVTSTTSFTVNINSTSFSTYTSGGVANIVTGSPALQGGSLASGNALGFSPLQAASSQVQNTPLFNQGAVGITLGSSLMVTTSDVWQYVAELDCDFTSA